MALSRRIARWLLGSIAVISALLLGLLLFVDSDILKAKLRTTVEKQSGGQVNYQDAELSILPRPSITLHQVKLDIAGQVQGAVGSIQAAPDLLALLTGQVNLATLVLESPEISLQLTGRHASKEEPPSEITFLTLQNSLIKGLEPLLLVAPDLALVINNGVLTFNQEKQALGLFDNIDLKLDLDSTGSRLSQGRLRGSISKLTIFRGDRKELLENLKVNVLLRSDEENISLAIESLSLASPSLELNGQLTSTSISPLFTIELNGKALDVDAIRETTLSLAGDTSPTKEIFDYLRGGRVPQISFHSRGETVSELGDLENILIEGQLQAGAVSIPEIELDLTEVNGDVVIANGVLQGSRMSTRLEGSTGYNGLLKVALADDNDLFQLELMLKANLPQAQRILKRVVDNPDFIQYANKITNLEGTSTGKLVLGDSLNDLNARVDISDLELTADYQDLPFPIGFTQGQISFSENQVVLGELNGTMGSSSFSGIKGKISWEDLLHLDIGSGAFDLSIDQIYPWVVSYESTKELVKELKQITGSLNLASMSFNGAVGVPEQWQFAASGSIKDLVIETPRFPDKIELAKGDFTLDQGKFAFHDFEMDTSDTSLVLGGTLEGLLKGTDKVELTVDGEVGQGTVAWLRDALETETTVSVVESSEPAEPSAPAELAEPAKLAESAESVESTSMYMVRSPLTFSETTLLWQADAETTFTGNVVIADGPNLFFDVDYRPEQLQVKRLVVKDQYSDAEAAFDYGQDKLSLSFTGTLDHRTLESIFKEQTFGSGQLNGNFSANIPLLKQTEPVANGHLQGEGLVIPLPSGEEITVDQVDLHADGSQVNVEATTAVWKGFSWDPFKARIDLSQDTIDINITDAKLCGIDSTGVLAISGKNFTLNFNLNGKGLDVETSYSCLTKGRVKMTGLLDFTADISSQGEVGELLDNMQGPIEMSFSDGTIEQSKLLARTLEVLNVTEIVKGRLPNLRSSAFNYSSITMQGAFQGRLLNIEKVFMEGETLDVLGEGTLDFKENRVNVELLAAPLKTVDTVVKNLPGVNYLLAGSLVAIPVSVKGDLNDPKVRVMSVSSVGSGLLNLGERIIKSPLKLIETIIPTKDKGKK